MRAKQVLYRTIAIAALMLVVPFLALGGGALGKEAKKASSPTPWTRPVPRAECGPNDHVESGLQGQTSLAERESGESELGYNCNLELVGQFQGEGMWWFGSSFNSGTDSSTMFDNRSFSAFDDCFYYTTRSHPLQQNPGAVVIDASDPRNPHPTAYLDDTPTMLNPHESLKVHGKRQLLAAVERPLPPVPGRGFAIYDLSADCRHPVLKASVVLPDVQGHAGNFTPDGRTYYGTSGAFAPVPPERPHFYAIDVADPSNPRLIGKFFHSTHDISFSEDGTRAYLAPEGNVNRPTVPGNYVAGPNGLVILDVSDIQFRRPNPQVRVISTLFWEDGAVAQQPLPVTIKGRPYVIVADEAGWNLDGGRVGACARGIPPSGFARIIDISDERNPKIVSKLMLEVHDPANCPVVLTDPPLNNYSVHYCSPDNGRNPKMLACSYINAGLRVFDIRDPYRPREIAYYKPPARRTAFLPGSNIWSATADRTVDFTSTDIRWRKHKGETHLWFASSDNGFQIVRFTKSMHELLGKGKGKDDDDDRGKRGRDNDRRGRDRDDDD